MSNVEQKKRLRRKGTPGLERRGKGSLIFIALTILLTQSFIVVMAYSYNATTHKYQNMVTHDLVYQKNLYALMSSEKKATIIFQDHLYNSDASGINHSEKKQRTSKKKTRHAALSRSLSRWQRDFDFVDADHNESLAHSEFQKLKEIHNQLFEYYLMLLEAIETDRMQEARSYYHSNDLVFKRDSYEDRILLCIEFMHNSYQESSGREQDFSFWHAILVVLIAPLLISVALIARRSVIAAHVQPIVNKNNTALSEKYGGKRTTTIHDAYSRNEILANISREVRMPMNSIIGLSALLMDSDLDGEHHEMARSIQGSAQILLNIIDDVLVLSRIEAGDLELESEDFDLRVCMEDAMDVLGILAEDCGTECSCVVNMNVPYLLCGDAVRLRQVVINLVGEMIKHQRGGNISVRLALKYEDESTVTVNVVVTGLDHQNAGKVSNQMLALSTQDQVSHELMKKYGFTLGVTKEIVERMHGELGVSEDKEVPIFWFDARFAKQGEEAHTEQDVCRDLRGKKILVADSGTSNRSNLVELLRNWGCIPHEAINTTSALELLHHGVRKNEPFDIVLVDMNIEYAGGNEFVRSVKSHASLKSIIAVMMIPIGEHAQKQEIGLAAYIPKPIMQSRLYETLAKAVRRQAAGPTDRRTTQIISERVYQENVKNDYRVLLVEDNPVNSKLTARLLEKCGYAVNSVDNGKDACQQVLENSFDLILMDCQMPIMDGYDAAREIRKKEASNRRIPIIAMTANAMKGDRERCLEAGMDDYLSKPIRVEDMVAALARWLGSGSKQHKASALEKDTGRRKSRGC